MSPAPKAPHSDRPSVDRVQMPAPIVSVAAIVASAVISVVALLKSQPNLAAWALASIALLGGVRLADGLVRRLGGGGQGGAGIGPLGPLSAVVFAILSVACL